MDPWGEPYGGLAPDADPCFLVSNPCEYLHIQVIRFFLRLVDGWPGRELGEKRYWIEGRGHEIYNILMSILFFVLQFWYLLENAARLTFFELGHMYVALLMNVLSTSRGFTLCLSQRYKNLAAFFLSEFHVFYHKDKSDYSRKIYATVHLGSKWFTMIQLVFVILTLVLFNIVPVLMNLANGRFEKFEDPVNATLELSIYFKLPKDPEKNIIAYCYSLFINFYASSLCVCSIIMFDLLFSLMIFNIWGHFKILLYSLETMPKPAAAAANDGTLKGLSVMYTPEEQVKTAEKLKENIIYHRFIIDFTNEMSSVFGIVLFVYYMFHQVSGCLLLLECSQGAEALARYMPLTVMMTAQLIQTSIIFEIIGTMSEKLRDEVYCLPWEYMNTSNRKTVMLFLINVQDPVHIKAGGLVDVGVTTMAGILRRSFSYFAFLRTMSL